MAERVVGGRLFILNKWSVNGPLEKVVLECFEDLNGVVKTDLRKQVFQIREWQG